MEKFRFAIVGCGVIHGTHVDAIRKLGDDAELVAVCDEVEEKARKAGEKHGVPYFTSLTAMLEGVEFDIVNICTPSGLHATVGIEAANAGKHLVCEKPIDVTLEAADALIAACEKNNVKLVVISQHRYSSGMIYLKNQLDAGRLGRLCYAESETKWYRTQGYYDSGGWRGTWALDGGGALMNQGVHYVDQLLWAMGPVKSVYANMATLAHERIEVEDTLTATLTFENGAIGTLTATTSIFSGGNQGLEVHGTGGSVIIENSRVRHAHFTEGMTEEGVFGVKAPPPEIKNFVYQLLKPEAETTEKATNEGEPAGSEPKPAEVKAEGALDPTSISMNGHVEHLKDLMGAIRENRETFMNGHEARKALELILAVYQSARTGQPVTLPL